MASTIFTASAHQLPGSRASTSRLLSPPFENFPPASTDYYWILWLLPIAPAVTVAWWSYRKAYTNTLLAGAGISGLGYAAFQPDTRTPRALLGSAIFSYIIFHFSYCCSIASVQKPGYMFFPATVVFTLVCFGLLSLFPGSGSLWIEGTSLGRVWSIIPLHLAFVVILAWLIGLGGPSGGEGSSSTSADESGSTELESIRVDVP